MAEPLQHTVLVTGGAGFLGRVLVGQILQQTGWRVRVLALPREPVPPEWADHHAWAGRVQALRGDITSPTDVDAAVRGCRQVFHLAALVGDAGTDAQHQHVTVGGTAHVFDAAMRHQAQVLITTSICTYGDAIQRGPCAEDQVWGEGQGPYGRAKQGQEKLAHDFARRGGQVCVVRPANIVGPGSGPWLLDAAHALRQGLPALIGGGQGHAALTVVDNVAAFLLLAARSDRAWGQAFNIEDDLPVTWARYFGDLAAMMGVKAPRSIPRAVAYAGAAIAEPVWRTLWPRRRPPVTREALNLIAWDSHFPTAKARALGWAPTVGYEALLQALRADIAARGL
jgi:nucleoside-diphosphate-sugar epimerase